ncbi:MAG: CHAT domain-containing protein [Deltaproteobacteria bacterium]|nr:CHAT domain-containing protein [Deltaproteobacteria bacterium]
MKILDKQFRGKNRKAYFYYKCSLAINLAQQGRLLEAELEIREVLKEVLGLAGRESGEIARIFVRFGEILLMQGRFEDTKKLMLSAIRILEASGFSRDSYWYGEVRRILGEVSVAREDFNEAMKQFSFIMKDMRENPYALNLLAQNPNFMVSLLKTGRIKAAMKYVTEGYRNYREYLGTTHFRTAEMLGLRGMANAMMGKKEQAMKDFSSSIPPLLKERADESGSLRKARLKIIIEAYIDLLTEIHKSTLEEFYGVHAAAEIFKMSEALNGSIVQSALGASGARAAAVFPDLADLVRREQDASKQIDALKRTLSNALAAPPDQQNPKALYDLKTTIDSLTRARTTILDDIKGRFPKYAEFMNPQTPGFSEIQATLRSGEALIVIYPARDKTYVWGIPKTGEVAFAAAPLGREALRSTAVRLRKTLAPLPGTFGDIPDYDIAQAYEIFDMLLEPVASGWKGAKDLLIVSAPPLGQIPFSVLPTKSVKLAREQGLLFENYREVPWLIRKCSVTRLPSVSSLVTLRALPQGDANRKSFLGFGDPYFNPRQMAQAKAAEGEREIGLSRRGAGQLRVRGIRKTKTATLEDKNVISSHIGMLNRLPDTAEEIISIAKALDADPNRDIFLGEKASERRVKGMELSDRKVIAFATHGLVPGDIDGLEQPALALSSPAVTKDNEDGLLTVGEILKMRMNADWVVLSACNTGAAEGAGAEAVSGLGRAFFYAGSRALLVSMWPVETTSAKRLTTGLFRFQKQDPALSRAGALQKSVLYLMDKQILKDETSGKIVTSYAHPFFWAPFIVVGDGG